MHMMFFQLWIFFQQLFQTFKSLLLKKSDRQLHSPSVFVEHLIFRVC